MSRITNVTPQKRKGRFNVEVDGDFWAGVSSRILAKHNLYKDKQVGTHDLDEIFYEEILFRLYDGCIRKLSNRPQSRMELQWYMDQLFYKKRKIWFSGTRYESSAKTLISRAQKEVLDKLTDERLISDESFAQWWVDQRLRNGKKGWDIIRSELISKGIESQIIESVRVSKEQEKLSAKEAYEKLCERKGLDREKCVQRLRARGFSWDSINEIVPRDGRTKL